MCLCAWCVAKIFFASMMWSTENSCCCCCLLGYYYKRISETKQLTINNKRQKTVKMWREKKFHSNFKLLLAIKIAWFFIPFKSFNRLIFCAIIVIVTLFWLFIFSFYWWWHLFIFFIEFSLLMNENGGAVRNYFDPKIFIWFIWSIFSLGLDDHRVYYHSILSLFLGTVSLDRQWWMFVLPVCVVRVPTDHFSFRFLFIHCIW